MKLYPAMTAGLVAWLLLACGCSEVGPSRLEQASAQLQLGMKKPAADAVFQGFQISTNLPWARLPDAIYFRGRQEGNRILPAALDATNTTPAYATRYQRLDSGWPPHEWCMVYFDSNHCIIAFDYSLAH